MFKKLRNRFILINLVATSLILVAAFSTIYVYSYNALKNRRPVPQELTLEFTEETTPDEIVRVRHVLEERVLADRSQTLNSLLISLILAGIAVELIIAIFSFYFSEEAIRPVREAYETQKIFIANASHEIKTPVAAIKANLEAADLSESNHWIKNIELEADKIERLNLDLLKLAKTDAIKEAVVLEDVKLRPLVETTLKSFESRLKKDNISLKTKFNLKDKTSIKLNPADFKEILEILTDNAIKYCKSSIELSVSQKSLTIKNDGTTIPKEKLPHVFDRFYQVDKSASGSGLGLAIASSLASRNNWSLKVASDASSTSFTLSF
ncbi:HAMP domain-containing histidine kinase [Candidatus Saccharibacteria bacterium]|nr:HAMP domain-containing histidine kinase [Candidatus Saccharibacteria bacterium]